MADQASTATSKVRESMVLTEASLAVLAREVGGNNVNGLVQAPSTATSKVRESMVLTEASLAVLAREVGGNNVNGLVLCMYLNIPTTSIVNATNSLSDVGHTNANETIKIEITQKLLLQWKALRAASKEKDKVRDLERALKELGKPDWADVINDKHANQIELTAECFAT